jgi:hypothetical protein
MANLAFHSMALQEYYVNKYNWTSKTISSIWWSTYFKPLLQLSDEDTLRIKKFVNNRWPTLCQEQTYYNKTSTSSHCRQCWLYSEDEDHIIRCRTQPQQKIRDKWRAEIIKFFSEQHTPPAVRDAICHGFFNWLKSGRNTHDIPPLPQKDMEVMKVHESRQALDGNISYKAE